jgi:hypothetical protein
MPIDKCTTILELSKLELNFLINNLHYESLDANMVLLNPCVIWPSVAIDIFLSSTARGYPYRHFPIGTDYLLVIVLIC